MTTKVNITRPRLAIIEALYRDGDIESSNATEVLMLRLGDNKLYKYRPTSGAFRQLLLGMDRDGIIDRLVDGRRTTMIALVKNPSEQVARAIKQFHRKRLSVPDTQPISVTTEYVPDEPQIIPVRPVNAEDVANRLLEKVADKILKDSEDVLKLRNEVLELSNLASETGKENHKLNSLNNALKSDIEQLKAELKEARKHNYELHSQLERVVKAEKRLDSAAIQLINNLISEQP